MNQPIIYTGVNLNLEEFISTRLKNALKLVVNKIETWLAELEELENKRVLDINKIESIVDMFSNRVKMDIGGKLFEVSKETLMSIPNTFFYELIANSDKFKPLDDGTYFIERNPVVFDRILDYLQTGKLNTRELTPSSMDILKDDLDYYCIPCHHNHNVSKVKSTNSVKSGKQGLTKANTTTTAADMTDEFKNIFKETQSSLKELKDLETKRNSVIKKIEQTIATAQNRVKINVRGSLFSTSKKTLMAVPNTYFCGLIDNSDKFKPLDDGTYFIERSPVVFDKVLDYLRTRKLDSRNLTPLSIDLLKDDFDYYCIPLPNELNLLCWVVNNKVNFCTFTNNNLTLTQTPSNEVGTVIGNIAVDKYTVKLESGFLIIGFTQGRSCEGWFLHTTIDTINLDANHAYFHSFNIGDYITVIREGTTIRFEKNKTSLPECPVLKGIPDQPLFPAIQFYRGGRSSVTLINDY